MAITWDSANKDSDITLSAGDLTATKSTSAGTWASVKATMARNATEARYFEVLCVTSAFSQTIIGIGGASQGVTNTYIGSSASGYGWQNVVSSGKTYNNATPTTTTSISYTAGDVIMVAVKNGKIWWGKNGTWILSGDPVAETGEQYSGLSGDYFPMWTGNAINTQCIARFTESDFTYSLPAGFSAWESVSNNISNITSGKIKLLGSVLTTEPVPSLANNNITVVAGKIILQGNVLNTYVFGDNTSLVSSGKIKLLGQVSHTISSNLLGANAYSVTSQHTQDLYYLADELHDYTVDYWPPYANDMALGYVGAVLTSNVPVTTTTFSINAGHLAASYLQDFYYRIHLSVYNIQLGNVLSEQTYALSIWNAWFSNQTLSTIGNTNLDSITLNLGITLPKVFTPLQFIDGTITVAALGTPTVDGYFDFTFPSETPRLVIQGQRVIFWPHVPLTTFTETREWLTDIIPTMESEQRFALRESPRMTLSYSYDFRTHHEYSMAKSRARTISTLAIATALWTDVVNLTDLPVGTSVLYFDTSNLEIDTVQGVFVLWESFESFELVEISSFDATSVTLKNATLAEHLDCWVAPVKIGYLKNGIEFSRAEKHKITSNISITITNPYTSATWPSSDTYLSLPVLPEISIATGGLSEKMGRETESFDSLTGELIQFDTENYTRFNQALRLRAHTREQRYALRRQFDYLQGKYQLFWLPSFNNDLTAVNPISASSSTLKVLYSGWSKYPEQHIKVIGSVTRYFEVTAATDNGDGTESLDITPAADVDIHSIRSIQVITKVRLNSDRIEYNHENVNFTLVSAPVIEVA